MIKFTLPKDVSEIIKRVESAGFEIWCVGGCVRDMLRGISPDDYDLCSNAAPEDIKRLFEKTVPTGIKHGTVTVMLNGVAFEITRYRIDGEYTDSRRPDSVCFTSDIRKDLERRDFTMNAIAYHPKRGIFDLFSGAEDIKKKIIRTVGNPELRFSEDALRILRAVRFSAVTGFSIESETENAMKLMAEKLSLVSRERIRVETVKALSSPKPSALQPLIDKGGFRHMGLGNADISVLDSISADALLRFAALCFICGADTESTAKAFRFSNDEISKICGFGEIFSSEEPKISLFKSCIQNLGYCGVRLAAKTQGILYKKDNSDIIAALEKAEQNDEPYCLKMLALKSKDIMELGFKGEKIGDIQKMLLDAVLKNPALNSKEKLSQLILKKNENNITK